MKHTYLGPSQATFSALALEKFSTLFRVLRARKGEEVLAEKNEQVVPLVTQHGGFGVIAMETEAEGRIDPPLNSFVQLLDDYQTTEDCPIGIIAAMRMPVNFVLMARPGVSLDNIKTVIAHPKALGACKNRIKAHGILNIVESASNGKAAEEIAENSIYAQAGALGPQIAAKKYGLKILKKRFEDQLAITTFFLLGSKNFLSLSAKVSREANRSLIVFRLSHEPGSLAGVLRPFADVRLNLRQIHSYYVGNGQYDFAMEVECGNHQIKAHVLAMRRASSRMVRHIILGPFPVVEHEQ